MKAFVTVVVVSMGCAAEQPKTVTLEHERGGPVATVDASILPPSEHARPAANACLMLYECTCNAGCTSIDRSLDGLKVGMQVGVTSGPLKGSTVYVAKSATDTGEKIFTIQRSDPTAGMTVCGTPRSSTIGYLCATSNSGNARACSTCE